MKQQDLFGNGPPAAKPGEPPPGAVRAPGKAPAGAAPAPPRAAPSAAPLASPLPAGPAPILEAPAPAAKTPAAPPPAPAPAPSAPQVLTVSELTRALKDAIEPRFTRVLVRGEVSGFRGPNVRGHLYFAVKDAAASLDVKMWASAAARLKFGLKDGLQVVVEGYLQIYEPQGRYSLIANRLEPSGVGALALAFEQLKAKLADEGLFGPKRQKPKVAPPFLPRRIGVVTSVTGAALKDFLKVLHRRNPQAAVLVCDARVQGDGAALEIARALQWLQATDVDVIVLTRGGGSVEDLWAFNEEPVVRGIFASRVPVVSAVGHEVDVTLADFVADVRSPTPSAAAELLAPDRAELELALKQFRLRLRKAAERHVLVGRRELLALRSALGEPRRVLSGARLALSDAANRLHRAGARRVRDEAKELHELRLSLERASPVLALSQARSALAAAKGRLGPAARRELARHKEALAAAGAHLGPATRRELARQKEALGSATAKLDALSPLAVLSRGYSITTRERDGRVVRRAADVAEGELVKVRVSGDQVISAKVT